AECCYGDDYDYDYGYDYDYDSDDLNWVVWLPLALGLFIFIALFLWLLYCLYRKNNSHINGISASTNATVVCTSGYGAIEHPQPCDPIINSDTMETPSQIYTQHGSDNQQYLHVQSQLPPSYTP
ncbi:uncharacterized protein LOC144349295, partial [Saccoglossus kowalevskii]